MKYIKKYEIFINESLGLWIDSILNSINAEEVNIKNIIKNISDTDLESLNKNGKFINLLSKSGLKKSNIESTENYETFMLTPFKFMFLYDIDTDELGTPYYLLMQVYNKSLNKYEETKCYKVNADIKNFYDQLSSKKISIEDDGNHYIYETENGSNEWMLKSNNPTDIYKKYFRKKNLEETIKKRNAKVKIIL